MKVLVVDDSVVFRSAIKVAVHDHSGIEVVGVAGNGDIALQRLQQLSVDLITLDLEMPVKSGLETLKEIRKSKYPVRVIVFSSHSVRGSEAALDALAAGADDFVAKPQAAAGAGPLEAIENIRRDLLPKILQFKGNLIGQSAKSTFSPATQSVKSTPSSAPHYPRRDIDTFNPLAIVIASSTGGPQALEKALAGLKAPLRIPILIAQHMPPLFTASLAKRLSEISGIPAAEGVDGEVIVPNKIYIAPGDYHMTVAKSGGQNCIRLDQNPQRNSVRPAADYLFESAVEMYGSRTMGIILTGMGEDGLHGARAVKRIGGGIMIQNKESCVVFGMPGAIFNDGIYDGIGDLAKINALIKKMTN